MIPCPKSLTSIAWLGEDTLHNLHIHFQLTRPQESRLFPEISWSLVSLTSNISSVRTRLEVANAESLGPMNLLTSSLSVYHYFAFTGTPKCILDGGPLLNHQHWGLCIYSQSTIIQNNAHVHKPTFKL